MQKEASLKVVKLLRKESVKYCITFEYFAVSVYSEI